MYILFLIQSNIWDFLFQRHEKKYQKESLRGQRFIQVCTQNSKVETEVFVLTKKSLKDLKESSPDILIPKKTAMATGAKASMRKKQKELLNKSKAIPILEKKKQHILKNIFVNILKKECNERLSFLQNYQR